MRYNIFHSTLESDISLPELTEECHQAASIFYHSASLDALRSPSIDWCKHWRHPNGPTSISVGKDKEKYWVRFPNIADFELSPDKNHICSYSRKDIPEDTIRHLLLDQVIPRLLTHQGQQIIHASCINIGKSAIAFAGESGWGKSTLAAYFYSKKHIVLTDDCLLLQPDDARILAIPSYTGIRLLQDILGLMPENNDAVPVAHYGKKKRVLMATERTTAIPLSHIFILNNPEQPRQGNKVIMNKIHGAAAAIELIKHSFPLDPTNKLVMGMQMQSLARTCATQNLSVYSLSYPRNTDILPAVLTDIIQLSNT